MVALMLAWTLSAWGAPVSDAQQAQLDAVRAEVADQVQLVAYDLMDEMVLGWRQTPPFTTPTPVVLAGVSVPVGMGTGMQALLENHLNRVILDNPATHISLVHCPACTAVIVHSGPEGTVVSRGVDNPDALDELGSQAQHALFVDVEAEGTFLVLRARLTELSPSLPIVWSKTLSTSASTPALLRESDRLTSAAEAREEYLDVLRGRSLVRVPLRFTIRSYEQPNEVFSDFDGTSTVGVAPPPFLWVQSGVELASTHDRVWTSSIVAGFSFIPQAYQGLMLQSRVSRLITGRTRSLARPDLYGFVGAAVINVWGAATAPFQDETLNSDDIITALNGDDPRTSFGALHIGVDLRVGNRISGAMFLETLPSLNDSNNMGEYVRLLGIPFPSVGSEVAFCF